VRRVYIPKPDGRALCANVSETLAPSEISVEGGG
jgi:hypothetical protein